MTAGFFLLGLIVGSFLFAYVLRWSGPESVWRGRSRCPKCKRTLEWTELIPLISFLWSRGKCRYCGQAVSRQYPAAELATATVFALVWLWVRPERWDTEGVVTLVFYLYLAAAAVVLAAIDLRQKLLPDRVVAPAALVTLSYLVFLTLVGQIPPEELLEHVLAGVLAGLAFLAIVVGSGGRWMGGGDVKLFAVAGLLVGWPEILVATLGAFWLAAIPSLALLALGRRRLADEIPFGPFLLIAAALALVWGERLTASYLDLIGR